MINNILDLNVDGATAILFCAIALVLAVVAAFFLYRGVRKDRKRAINDKLETGLIKKDTFDRLVVSRFGNANKRTRFCMMYIEFSDVRNTINAFGEDQYKHAILMLVHNIEKQLPMSAKVCHYLNDAITILIDLDEDGEDIKAYANIIVMECRKPITLMDNLKLEFDVNMGVVEYNEFNRNPEEMWQNIGLALVSAKRLGINRYEVFSIELRDRDSDEYKYYQEIKTAIQDKDFILYYQPIVNIVDNQTIAYESLIRWNHKTLGVLPPSKFLNIMELSGDINWVGIWAFEELLNRTVMLRNRTSDKKIILTMNLSPKQLLNPKIVDDFRRLMRKYRVDPSKICLEIVEFALFDKMPTIKENIDKLHQSGFKLAVDNFDLDTGTIALLEKLSIDMIKLDKEFISKAKEDYISSAIVNLLLDYAKRNGATVIAEGIEDQEVLEKVKQMGIYFGQGYFLGKPKAPEEYNI